MIKLDPWTIESESMDGSIRIVTFNEFQMNHRGVFVPYDISSLYDVGQILIENDINNPGCLIYTTVVNADRHFRTIYIETDQNKLYEMFKK